jgi:hypothetical protein
VGENSYFNDGEDLGDERIKVLLEQYKLFVETSSRVSDRRGLANTFFMSVNTALVTIYGLAAGNDAPIQSSAGAAAWLILVAGLTICIGWLALIKSYRTLNRAKFKVILDIEERLAARLFEAEWHYLESGSSGRHVQLTYVEQLVPVVFGLIYAGLLATLVLP